MKDDSIEAAAAARAAARRRAQATALREGEVEPLRAALERVLASHERAALLMVEVSPYYVARAVERVGHVLEAWRRGRFAHAFVAASDAGRFLVLIAPVGSRAHARELGDEFARELDPRLCPSLRRALPYARCGVSLWPDDGTAVDELLERAERSLAVESSAPAREPGQPSPVRGRGSLNVLRALPAR